jgi:hypothetical protein
MRLLHATTAFARALTRRVVACTFVVSLVVRLASISTVLPEIHHTDELTNERVVLAVRDTPTKSPAFFAYPTFMFYSQAALLRAYEAVTGARVKVSRVISNGVARTQFPGHWVAARTLTAVLGSAAAALAAWLGVTLGGSLRAGWVVGLFAATSPLLVEDARYMTPDTYAAFFTLAALAGATLIVAEGTWKSYLFAGAMTGIAAGCKYNVALAAVAIVVAHLVRHGPKGLLDPRLYLAAAASIAAFIGTTPFAVLDYAHFRDGLASEAHHYQQGHPGAEGSALPYNLGQLGESEGLRLLFLPFVALAPRRIARLGSVCLLSFVVAYFALVSVLRVRFARNLVPLDYPILVLAGLGLAALAERIEPRWNRRSASTLVATAAALLSVSPGIRVAREIRERLHNTRSGAEEWIAAHLPRGSAVAVEAYGPWVDPDTYRVMGIFRYGELPDLYLERRHFRFVALAEGAYGRFFADRARYARQVARYEALFRDHCVVAKFRDRPGAGLDVVDLDCTSPTAAGPR